MSSMTSAVARPTGWSSGEVVLRPLFGLSVAGFRGGRFANGGPKGKRVESVEAHWKHDQPPACDRGMGKDVSYLRSKVQ